MFQNKSNHTRPLYRSLSAIALAVICTLLITLCPPAPAQAEEAAKSGWFGDLQVGGGVISARPSGLDVLDDNEKRDSLTSEGSRETEGFPLIGAEVGYRFASTGTTVSAGGGVIDPWHLSLGQDLKDWGRVTLSGLYEETEVWENPYLTEVDRSETDAASVGYSIAWDNILTTGIGVSFRQAYTDVDEDRIGELTPDLQRDGTDTTVALGYLWNWGAGGVLNVELRHAWIDRDGDSNSGQEYAAELQHVLERGRFSFATVLDLRQTDYDEIHPVFNEKREETAYGISETISFAEPFGYRNTYLFGLAAYSETDADITFFESSTFIAGAGVGYRF